MPGPAAVDSLSSTEGIVALAAAGGAFVAVVVAVVALLTLRRVRAEQRLVLGEQGDRDLVEHAASVHRRVEQLGTAIDELTGALGERLRTAERRLDRSVSRSAVIRYDAFNETSGRQSSSVALLDDEGNGVVLSAILQREQARVYAKPLHGGESVLELSPEEEEAIRRAQEAGAG